MSTAERQGDAPATGQRKPLSRRKRLLFSLIPLVVILASVEVVARVFSGLDDAGPHDGKARILFASARPATGRYREMTTGDGFDVEVFENDPERFWRLKPGVDFSRRPVPNAFFLGPVSNSAGFRNGEFAVSKPPGTVRVLCFGDSCTFGLCVNMADAWPSMLEGRLNRLNDGRRYEVINAGVPGYSSYQGLLYMRREIPRLSADIVVATFGNNDRWNWGKLSDAEHAERDQTRLATTVFGYSRALQLLTREFSKYQDIEYKSDWQDRMWNDKPEPGWKPRVSLDEFERNLHAMSQLCSRHNCRLVLGTWPSLGQIKNPDSDDWHAAYNKAARRFAEEQRIPLVDLVSRFLELRPQSFGMFVDNLHMNPLGNRRVSREVLRVLQDRVLTKAR